MNMFISANAVSLTILFRTYGARCKNPEEFMAVLHNKGGNSKLLRKMLATIVHRPPKLTSNGDLCSGTGSRSGSGSGPDSISGNCHTCMSLFVLQPFLFSPAFFKAITVCKSFT